MALGSTFLPTLRSGKELSRGLARLECLDLIFLDYFFRFTSLGLESRQRRSESRQFVGQKLQRDVAAEFEVFGFIDHAHAAADFADDAVVGNNLFGRSGLGSHWQNLKGKWRGGSIVGRGMGGHRRIIIAFMAMPSAIMI